MTKKRKRTGPEIVPETFEPARDGEEVEELAKDLLGKAIKGELEAKDREVWLDNGHKILHWLRAQFAGLAE